jgi:hypothetical protein
VIEVHDNMFEQLLCRLSYRSCDLTGVEPATSCGI